MQLGFPPCKSEQPLRELREKEGKKDEKDIGKLLTGVILEIEGSVRQRYKRALFP